MSESQDTGESPLSVRAEFHRLDAEHARLQSEVTERQRRMARIDRARQVLDAATSVDGPLEYAALVQAAEFEGIDLDSVIAEFEQGRIDLPHFATSECIQSSF